MAEERIFPSAALPESGSKGREIARISVSVRRDRLPIGVKCGELLAWAGDTNRKLQKRSAERIGAFDWSPLLGEFGSNQLTVTGTTTSEYPGISTNRLPCPGAAPWMLTLVEDWPA